MLHVSAHNDLRPGYRDAVELSPTVQCTPQNFTGPWRHARPTYLDLVRSPNAQVHDDVVQSEEEGRFHHAVTRHMVAEVGSDSPPVPPPDYAWLTVPQLTATVAFSRAVRSTSRPAACCSACGALGSGAGTAL